jgi:hypothetical protein
MDRIENDASNNSSSFSVFVSTGTSIPSRYPGTIMGIHTQTHRLMGGIYSIPRFITIISDIQKLVGGMHRHTDSTESA